MPQIQSISLADLIDHESRRIAIDLIQQKLESEGLPLPKDSSLAVHVDQILLLRPEIRTQAEKVVLARQDAFTESLQAIGIEVQIVEPIDIDL